MPDESLMHAWFKRIGLIPDTDKSQPKAEAIKPQPSIDSTPVGLANGNTMRVALGDGRFFPLENPSPDDVQIKHIAGALSKLCRFGGHTYHFYSVAQHCVLCAQESLRRRPEDDRLALACLLHDGAEAYIGDVVRPLKQMLLGVYGPIESRIQAAIWAKSEIELSEDDAAHIKSVDNSICRAEARVLMVGSERWNWGDVEASPHPIRGMSCAAAELEFMRTFNNLSYDTNTIPFRAPVPVYAVPALVPSE